MIVDPQLRAAEPANQTVIDLLSPWRLDRNELSVNKASSSLARLITCICNERLTKRAAGARARCEVEVTISGRHHSEGVVSITLGYNPNSNSKTLSETSPKLRDPPQANTLKLFRSESTTVTQHFDIFPARLIARYLGRQNRYFVGSNTLTN